MNAFYFVLLILAFVVPIGLGASLTDTKSQRAAYIAAAVIYLIIAYRLFGSSSGFWLSYLIVYLAFFTVPFSIGAKIRTTSQAAKQGLQNFAHRQKNKKSKEQPKA